MSFASIPFPLVSQLGGPGLVACWEGGLNLRFALVCSPRTCQYLTAYPCAQPLLSDAGKGRGLGFLSSCEQNRTLQCGVVSFTLEFIEIDESDQVLDEGSWSSSRPLCSFMSSRGLSLSDIMYYMHLDRYWIYLICSCFSLEIGCTCFDEAIRPNDRVPSRWCFLSV